MPTRLRIGLSLAAGVGLICLGLAAYIAHHRPTLPAFDTVRASHAQGSHDVLLDRSGLVIERWRRAGTAGWQAPWQSLENFPLSLRETVIASEDQRFFAHAGVDVRALLAGALASLEQRRGGSTLSMQTARLLLGREALPPTLWGKLLQIDAALALERRWSKAQILEAYLNLAPLRGGMRGFQTGQAMWLSTLSASEQARTWPLLVAMLPAPQASAAMLGRRSCAAARRVASASSAAHGGCGQHSAADWALWEAVWLRIFKPNTALTGIESAQDATDLIVNNAPSAANAIVSSAHKRSTVDGRLQAMLAQHLTQGLERMRMGDVSAAAAVLIDNASGEVLAYGSAASPALAPTTSAPMPPVRLLGLNGVMAKRTLASTLKPFLYAQALDARLLGTTERIQLREREFRQGACDLRPYRPRDSVALYQTQVSPALGLAASSNVAAVDIISRLQPARFESSLQALQILKAQPAESASCAPLPRYGHALALGAATGSLLDLTNAYRSLANGGLFTPATLWMDSSNQNKPTVVQAPQRVFSTSSAAWVSAALSDQRLRFEGFGPRNPLDTHYWSASKTGTSDGSRDNWAMGYTRSHTLGVWIGNTQGHAMLGIFGPAGAAQIWRTVMDSAEHMREGRDTSDPATLQKSSNAIK